MSDDAKKIAHLGTELLLHSLDDRECHPSAPCDTWLQLGRVISHDPISEDGEVYYCAHCGCKLVSRDILH